MQSLFCRDAFADLGAEFSSHFCQTTVVQPCVSVQNAVGISEFEALTAATFSGPVAVRGRPGDVCFNAEPVCLKFDTQRSIVFLSGTVSRRPGAKRMRNARCVATGDPPFFL